MIRNLKANFKKIPSDFAWLLCLIHKHQNSILSLYFFEHFIWPYMFCLGGLKNSTFFFSNFNFIRKIFDSLMESMNEILGCLVDEIENNLIKNEYCVIEAKTFLSILNGGVSKTSEGSKVKELINSLNKEFKIPGSQNHVRFFELQTKEFSSIPVQSDILLPYEIEIINEVKNFDCKTNKVSANFPQFCSSQVNWVSLVKLLTRNDEFILLRASIVQLSAKLKHKAGKMKEAFLEVQRFVESYKKFFGLISNHISKLKNEIKVSAKISKKCKGLITFDGSNLCTKMMNNFSNVINTKRIKIENEACFKIPCAKNYFGLIIRDAIVGLKLKNSNQPIELEVSQTILKIGDMSAIVH